MSINQYERLRIHEIITNDEFHQKMRETNRPKAFIGLGGMGGRTVDELKGLWKKEIEAPKDNVRSLKIHIQKEAEWASETRCAA